MKDKVVKEPECAPVVAACRDYVDAHTKPVTVVDLCSGGYRDVAERAVTEGQGVEDRAGGQGLAAERPGRARRTRSTGTIYTTTTRTGRSH